MLGGLHPMSAACAQEDAETFRTQWRQVADHLRPKVRKLAEMMDQAGAFGAL